MTTVVSTSACHAYGEGLWANTTAATLVGTRGCSSMVELQPSKLATRVRFPPPAWLQHRDSATEAATRSAPCLRCAYGKPRKRSHGPCRTTKTRARRVFCRTG